jgi:hypothetical protein
MNLYYSYLILLLAGLNMRVSAQGQIVTPDDQALSFQAAGGANNLLISQGTTYNTFVGRGAGQGSSSGSNNTFIGYQAGYAANAAGNTFLGYQAGYNTTSGFSNVFVGSLAGYNNSSGIGNMFLGQQAGVGNTTGSFNLFMGNLSGAKTTVGLGNTSIGDGAGYNNTTGSNNINLGRYAGYNLTTGSNNTFIGVAASAPSSASNINNSGAIGYNAQVTISNALVLGNNVNVGIGNTAPSAKLHLTSGVANSSGLRLENLTSGSPATAFNQYKFLSVDGGGNVILASLNGSAREGVSELWEAKGNQLQNANAGGVIIGKGVSKTSDEYNLFVSKGILTEKVKVAIKNTFEWSDKVFEKGYNLKSLKEVNQYIRAHNHLQGVPSAAEVVEKGVDLGKMDAKLLEKIEELTLYSIQLEKQNEQQAQRLQAVEQSLQQQQQKQARLEQQLNNLINHK